MDFVDVTILGFVILIYTNTMPRDGVVYSVLHFALSLCGIVLLGLAVGMAGADLGWIG